MMVKQSSHWPKKRERERERRGEGGRKGERKER